MEDPVVKGADVNDGYTPINEPDAPFELDTIAFDNGTVPNPESKGSNLTAVALNSTVPPAVADSVMLPIAEPENWLYPYLLS